MMKAMPSHSGVKALDVKAIMSSQYDQGCWAEMQAYIMHVSTNANSSDFRRSRISKAATGTNMGPEMPPESLEPRSAGLHILADHPGTLPFMRDVSTGKYE